MSLMWTALALKWVASWIVLSLFGLVQGSPGPGQATVIALALAAISWAGDRLVPFEVQGITRWALDSGLAAAVIYASHFLLGGTGMGFFNSILAGATIGAVEIPLHFYLAARFGLRRPEDNRDGVK